VHHERIDSWHYGRPTFGVQILHALTRLGAKMSKHPKLPELLRKKIPPARAGTCSCWSGL
jgi:hypothetical protein